MGSALNEIKKRFDGKVLHYDELNVAEHRVNLHSYHPEYDKDASNVNLGDSLSPLIVNWLLERAGIDADKRLHETKHLYALGSILSMGLHDATVWGAGFPYELFPETRIPHEYPNRKLDIRCVRGPKTRKTLLELGQKCPTIYGDPAVLMPYIYMAKRGG